MTASESNAKYFTGPEALTAVAAVWTNRTVSLTKLYETAYREWSGAKTPAELPAPSATSPKPAKNLSFEETPKAIPTNLPTPKVDPVAKKKKLF